MSNRWLQTRLRPSTQRCSSSCPILLPSALSSRSRGLNPRRQRPSHGPARYSRCLRGSLQWPRQGLQTQSRWRQQGSHTSCQWPRRYSWRPPPPGGDHGATRGGPCDDLGHRPLVLPPREQGPRPERGGLQLRMIETTGG